MTERTNQLKTGMSSATKELFSTKNLVMIAFLSALAYVLMLIHLPFKFIGFLELEFSDVPAVVGGIFYGPAVGVVIELIKNLIKAVTATTTGCVGEFANFVIGSAFVIPACMLFRKLKGKKRAFVSFGAATVSMVLVGALVNYFIMIPLYATMFGGMGTVVAVSSKMVPAIKDLATVVLFGITPFNFVKGIVLGVVSYYIHKPLRNRI
ncbi:ECF transporter S component [Anaerosporobacter sp.]|uniref:ECF transporter S component n=1 Tax=Anaerosporobacter sp. TaxID=1872529 RepID=UPI00286F9615|nr:ECF transporter S component [Anaerosporobacter sp.]